MAKVTSLTNRTKKGRLSLTARAIREDAKISDEKHLRGRIMSLTQVIYALILEREDPTALITYQKEELVTLNPDNVTIVMIQHARENDEGVRDWDVLVRLKPPKDMKAE